MAEVNGVPMHDRTDDQVEAGSAECVALKGAVADFIVLMEKDGALEFARGFAFVETGLATSTKHRPRIPFNHEQASLYAPSSRSALANSLNFCEKDIFRRLQTTRQYGW